jgi:pimeloyl-ACP methyl ester carboxylesterase
MARATNFGPDCSASQIDHVTRLSSDAPVEIWTNMLRGLVEMDLREALGNITVPALVVVGDRDTLTPKTSAMAIRAALPEARAFVLTRAGHLAMMERHRVFNELLQEHLDRVFGAVRAAG